MSNNRTENVIKNSAASMAYKVIHMIVQFLIRTVFIHILGNEYTGISGLFTDILQVLSVMELGLDSSMVYALYKPLAQKDVKKIAGLLLFYKKAFFVIGFIVLAAGLSLMPFLNYIVKDIPDILENINGIFLMYVLTSACSYFLIHRTVLLRADQQSRTISNCSSIVDIVECAVEITLLVVFRRFYAYLIVHFIANIFKNIILSIIAIRRYPEYFDKSAEVLSVKEKKRLYRDLACLTVYNISGVAVNSTDSIFISAFVGTAEVAIIGNHTLIINSLQSVVGQVVNASKASIGNLAATSSKDKQESIFEIMNFISFWVACFSCTCLRTLLNLFVGDIWFDASYKIPESIITILAINFFIAIMVFPVESFRTANGLFVQGWYRPAFMAVLNIILDIYMGQKWGIAGIFLATSISRLLTQVWFDPYLVYKFVFKKSPKKYYMDYMIYFFVTVLSSFTATMLCHAIQITNGIIDFGCKMMIAGVIPNIYISIFFHKASGYFYLLSMFRKFIRKMRG